MTRKRETVRFAVGEHGIGLADAGRSRADDFARPVPLVLHHRRNRNAEARFTNDSFGDFFVRPPAIHDDRLREGPFRVRKAPQKYLFQGCDVIVFSGAADAKRPVIFFDRRSPR